MSTITTNIIADNQRLFNKGLNLKRRCWKACANVQFMEQCTNNGVLPNFTRIKAIVIKQASLSPMAVQKLRTKKLNETLETSICNLEKIKLDYNNYTDSIIKLLNVRCGNRFIKSKFNTECPDQRNSTIMPGRKN